MFFITLGIYTRWSFIVFSLAQRILLLIFQCHTVTHGTDLRKSPHECRHAHDDNFEDDCLMTITIAMGSFYSYHF